MKLIAKFDDGREVELKEIKGLKNGDMLIGISSIPMRPQAIDKISEEITKKVGKKFVLLPSSVDKIFSV